MERGGAVYILTNKNNTVLYTRVTSNLKVRLSEHQEKKYPNSFTARYNIYKLVYFKGYHSIDEAIAEEKRIKAGSRKMKNELIERINPTWNDLSNQL
jgi:putative endonuclease